MINKRYLELISKLVFRIFVVYIIVVCIYAYYISKSDPYLEKYHNFDIIPYVLLLVSAFITVHFSYDELKRYLIPVNKPQEIQDNDIVLMSCHLFVIYENQKGEEFIHHICRNLEIKNFYNNEYELRFYMISYFMKDVYEKTGDIVMGFYPITYEEYKKLTSKENKKENK